MNCKLNNVDYGDEKGISKLSPALRYPFQSDPRATVFTVRNAISDSVIEQGGFVPSFRFEALDWVVNFGVDNSRDGVS
ncbi:hypothetical protein [Rhodopirellula baltica]|uniref:hypothetical protein n=1 Tax=Rhodopirellula baltica TaxID=265606 RepID=UPI0005629ABF|nr:hypothetical protein [Rhodopirellula baltica]